MNLPLLLTLLVLAFAGGVVVGSWLDVFSFNLLGRPASIPGNSDGRFRFLRASAPGDRGSSQPARELKPFRYKVNELIGQQVTRGDASSVSVYFRDLNNGNWFGIREHEKFSPVGNLKIPLMIAYFKWAETSPLVLRKTLTYTGSDQIENEDHEKAGDELEHGRSYTVNELIFRMITRDDAAAYALLHANIPPARLDRIFKDLYVEYDPRKQDDSITLSAYASFFRVLYNASYLSEEMSEKALRYLSRSSFHEGMEDGVPPNVEIALKEGERTVSVAMGGQGREMHQLHEFGIVYHPARPFLIGIAAEGTSVDKTARVIRDITRLVYEEVDNQS